MFICDECVAREYDNNPDCYMRSYGACEICDKVCGCADINTYLLIRKGESVEPQFTRGHDGTYYPTKSGWDKILNRNVTSDGK